MMSSCLKLWLWNGSGSWGWTARQMESVADGGSHGELRVEEVPPGAVCLLPSHCLPMERPVVMVLHLMVPEAACASLEVFAFPSVIFNVSVSTQDSKLGGKSNFTV